MSHQYLIQISFERVTAVLGVVVVVVVAVVGAVVVVVVRVVSTVVVVVKW